MSPPQLPLVLFLQLIIFSRFQQAPALPQGFDLHAQWWTQESGSNSYGYLTKEFRDHIFVPAMDSVIRHIDEFSKQLQSQENFDLGLGISAAFVLLLLMMFAMLQNKRITSLAK